MPRNAQRYAFVSLGIAVFGVFVSERSKQKLPLFASDGSSRIVRRLRLQEALQGIASGVIKNEIGTGGEVIGYRIAAETNRSATENHEANVR
jgi:hypothetical protein